MARSHGRETRIWIHVYVVCRETEKEAKDYLHHYVYEKGDWEAAGNLLRIFGMQSATLDSQTLDSHKAHFIAGHGGYPPVGTAEQIVDELGKLADIGVDGCLISWVDYKNELRSGTTRCCRSWCRPACGEAFLPAGRDRPQARRFTARSCNDGHEHDCDPMIVERRIRHARHAAFALMRLLADRHRRPAQTRRTFRRVRSSSCCRSRPAARST